MEKRFGILGYPVQGTQSPRLFTAAYGGRYPYDLVETPDFEEAWARFLKDYAAVNVTAPFKETAYRKVAELEASGRGFLSDAVRRIGATNLMVKTERGVEAHNSDYLGVRAVLSAQGFGPGQTAVLAGWGGAAKAAAAAAEDLGMGLIRCNRTIKEAGILPLDELPRLCASADLLIYTLPTAIPQVDGLRCAAILEANYKTPCLQGCSNHYLHGRSWLIAQAELGYALMSGEEPDTAAIRAAGLR